MSVIKLCKNCKFFSPFPLDLEFSKCNKFIRFSRVTGEVLSNSYAGVERQDYGSCRPCGIYYEEKYPEDFPPIIDSKTQF